MLGGQHGGRGLCGARGGLLGGRRGCGWAGLHRRSCQLCRRQRCPGRSPARRGRALAEYPFVRLHQASSFYGVASTHLGEDRLQENGPEAGMHERATAPEICAYYARVRERLLGSGQVFFYPNCDYLGEGRFISRLSGQGYEVRGRCRVVDARYLSPMIPATSPPPFGVADGVHAVTVNDLVNLA